MKKKFNMKAIKIYNSLLFLFCTFLISSCTNSISRFNGNSNFKNNYGLKIIDNLSEYKTQCNIDSNSSIIDLEKYILNLHLDIRYATSNNFTKKVLYDKSKAYVRLPVAKSLLKIQNELKQKNIGLIIFDAYRPYSVTLKFWDLYQDTNFVAAPWTGSRHNRGCAVDVSLYDLETGKELAMPTKFDDFSEKANPTYQNLSEEKLKNRKTLIDIMTKNGFKVYETEWWHFDYVGYEKFDLMDITFDELDKN